MKDQKLRGLQNPDAHYTIPALRNRVTTMFREYGVDEGGRVSSLIIDAWLTNRYHLIEGVWDSYIDDDESWHIRIQSRKLLGFKGGVVIPHWSEPEFYEEMFAVIQLQHNTGAMGFKPEINIHEVDRCGIKTKPNIRTVKAENVVKKRKVRPLVSKALSASELDEMARDLRVEALSTIELLGQGNYHIRS